MLGVLTRKSSVSRPDVILENAAFSSHEEYSSEHEEYSPDDDLAFFQGLGNALLPSLALWALIFGAIAWAFF
jgi:hypothetical protein